MRRYYDDDEFEGTSDGSESRQSWILWLIGVMLLLLLLFFILNKLTGFSTTEPITRVVDPLPAQGDEMIPDGTADRVPAWWSPGGEYAGLIDLAWHTVHDGDDPVYVQACNGDSCPWVLRTDADVPFLEPTSLPAPTDRPYTAPVVSEPVFIVPTAEPVMPCADIIVDGANLGTACAWTAEERMAIAEEVRLQHDTEQSVQVIYEGGDPLPTPVPTRQPLVTQEEDTPLLQDRD